MAAVIGRRLKLHPDKYGYMTLSKTFTVLITVIRASTPGSTIWEGESDSWKCNIDDGSDKSAEFSSLEFRGKKEMAKNIGFRDLKGMEKVSSVEEAIEAVERCKDGYCKNPEYENSTPELVNHLPLGVDRICLQRSKL